MRKNKAKRKRERGIPGSARPNFAEVSQAASGFERAEGRPEYAVLHPSHRPGVVWGFAIAIASIILTLAAQSLMPPAKVEIVNMENAVEGDPLPIAASENPRHLIEIENGLDIVAVPDGRSYTYHFGAPGVTACQMTSPVVSGIATTASMTIPPEHPWYPQRGRPVVFRIFCTDGETLVGDSAVVVLQSDT